MSSPTFERRLDQILSRRDELQALLAEAVPSEYGNLAREYATLEPVVAGIERYHAARREAGELATMLDDPEMRSLAEDELRELEARLPVLERELRILLLPKGHRRREERDLRDSGRHRRGRGSAVRW
jgi:peptide chain release factor 1